VLSRRSAVALLGGATMVVGMAVAVPVARADDPPPSGSIGPIPIPPLPIPPILTPPAPEPKPTNPSCSTAHQPFVPYSMNIENVADGIPVVALHRVNGHPGTPPLSNEGKRQVAFDLDSGTRPGDASGNSLFNAHTWPDGSALGNRLLADLQEGDRITVRGDTGRLCYKVTDRVEVSEYDTGKRYYAQNGRPQLAIVACSGRRLGPEHWTKRTIWYASPVR
jgi:hypothetical protein